MKCKQKLTELKMNELLNILTELLDEIRNRLPMATEDQKNDLRGLVRAYNQMINGMDGVANAGLSWTATEETELLKAYGDGMSFQDLAAKHSRTLGAIVARLDKLVIDTAKPTRQSENPRPTSLVALIAARSKLAK